MKFRLNQPLIDHKGLVITEQMAPNGPPSVISLGLALERAAVFGGNAQDNGTAKYEQYKLAQLVAKGGEVDLPSEQVTLFKELAARVYNAVGYGAIVEALEGRGAQAQPDYVAEPLPAIAVQPPTPLPADGARSGDIEDLLAQPGDASLDPGHAAA